ncbi:MAG: transglycosylase family protein [Nostocoides sp.]
MLFAPEFPTAPTRRRPVRGGVVGAGLLLTAALGGGLGLAATAGAAETVWDRVAVCVSGGNWTINTGNGYYGGLQFSPGTWKAFGGLTYAASADLATKDQQIYTAQQVLKVQGPGAWPTCSVSAGLTVANGLAVVVDPGGTPAPAPTPTPTPTPPPPISRDYARALIVDGSLGPLTRGAAERWFGGSLNGTWSVDDVRKLQTKVGSYPDGDIGPITTKALQRKVGADVDGDWGPQTTTFFQRFLNKTVYGQ